MRPRTWIMSVGLSTCLLGGCGLLQAAPQVQTPAVTIAWLEPTRSEFALGAGDALGFAVLDHALRQRDPAPVLPAYDARMMPSPLQRLMAGVKMPPGVREQIRRLLDLCIAPESIRRG